MSVITFCPECAHRLKLGSHFHIGQRKVCPKCNTQLEVVSLSPLVLDIYAINRPTATKTPNKRNVVEVICPECEHPLKLGTHLRKGQWVICPKCQTRFELVSVNPLELDTPIINYGKQAE